VDLEPEVFIQHAAAEQDAYLRGYGGELSGAIGWYRVQATRQMAVRAQWSLRRTESDPYRLTRGIETESWDESGWLWGPRFRLFWQPSKGHALTVDMELFRQHFDKPEQLERIIDGQTEVWSKARQDASTQVRVQLSQHLWRGLSILLRADLYGRESSVGANEGDVIDRRLARHYVGLGLRWQQDGP